MKRLTLIANFNEENLEKIKSTLVGINKECVEFLILKVWIES